MSKLITKEEITELRNSIVAIDYVKIIMGQEKIKSPFIMLTKSNYVLHLGHEIYPDCEAEHLSVMFEGDEKDAASCDCIARDILGEEYEVVGDLMHTDTYHYLRFVSGDRISFDDFVEYMKKGGMLALLIRG